MKQQPIALSPSRWSAGLKLISFSWAVLLFCAWLNGEVTMESVMLCGIVPGAIYWTMASFLRDLRDRKVIIFPHQ
jgi:hypothetical protein